MTDKINKILGIDYGGKRVGVAISDEGMKFALPVTVIENSPLLLEEVSKIALDNSAKEIVLGESNDYSGKPNPIMLEVIEFKKHLEEKGYIVHFELEFMTSVQAERLQGKNKMSDASAAALILQSYLDKIKSI